MSGLHYNADFLTSIVDVLRHIRDVEKQISQMSKESMLKIESFMLQSAVAPTPEAIEALQYQDIMSQQLGATIEAIDSIERSIALYIHSFRQDTDLLGDNLQNLNAKLQKSLEQAKSKKEAFSGKTSGEAAASEIEFF